ncbi:MAG: hypothetical protein M3R43_08885 [Acidobacteriota bacterium]|nr:hypothetical protein [Acidobacteriota bacterium]
MKNLAKIANSLLTLALATGTCAVAAEHHVACNTLPAAVQQKSKPMLDGATVHGCVQDVSKSKTTYEIESLKAGRSKDITFDADGNVLEIEEQVDMASLPGAVAAAIQKEAAGGQIGKVESLTRGGAVVSYETTISRSGKRHEVAFHPDGSPMKAD